MVQALLDSGSMITLLPRKQSGQVYQIHQFQQRPPEQRTDPRIPDQEPAAGRCDPRSDHFRGDPSDTIELAGMGREGHQWGECCVVLSGSLRDTVCICV
ncbi:hypothetical protein FKM82_030489 [Ascaphus truei]